MANTAPAFSLGQVPAVADWLGYFIAKVDASGGTLTNGTITGTCPGAPTWTGLHTFSAGLATTGSANLLTITGSDASSAVSLIASGTDTNVGVKVSPKGTGTVQLWRTDIGNNANGQGVFDGSSSLTVHGNNTFSSTASGTFNAFTTCVGSVTSGSANFNTISITDTVNTTTGSGPSVGRGLFVNHLLNAGFTGERIGLLALLTINGAGNAFSAGDNSAFLAAAQLNASANANVGGSGSAAVGNLCGWTSQVTLNSGATFYALAECAELGLTIKAGADSQYVNILKLSAGSPVAGVHSYNGLALGKSGSNLGFQTGIMFAPLETTDNPIDPTGTLIGVGNNGATLTAAYGMDLSLYTFSSAFLKSKGFLVDGSGNITATNLREVLYKTGISVGNGADTTEDTLQTYTMPANQLVNVGDMLRIVASGTFAATTDSKAPRLKFGGNGISVPNTNSSSVTKWTSEAWVLKTAANAQSYAAVAGGSGNNGNNCGTLTVTDTSSIVISVTGQNSTSSAAGSITCQFFMVEYIPNNG